jgi:hypothetical protein
MPASAADNCWSVVVFSKAGTLMGRLIRGFFVFVEVGQCVSIEGVDGVHANVVIRDVHLAPKDDETSRWSEGIREEVTV